MSRKKKSTDRRIEKLEEMIQEIEKDIELLKKDKEKVKHQKISNLIDYWIIAREMRLRNLQNKLNELKSQEKSRK